MYRLQRTAPHVAAGIFGMLLVAGLYIGHALLVELGGLHPLWLLVLLLPGALAAHLSFRRGMQSAWEREGALAGVLTAHFASALQVSVLFVAVATTDWSAYAQAVGPQVAAAAREAALPASLVVTAALLAITYSGCVVAGWLGALAYKTVVGVPSRARMEPTAGSGKGGATDWEG